MKSTRKGFTLVELLVVIAILGLLIAIMLPAVNTVRAIVRRATCSNNMRQVVLASIQYEVTNKKLPYGIQLRMDKTSEIGTEPIKGTTALTSLLANLEEASLFEEYNFDLAPTDDSNIDAVRIAVEVLICPDNDNKPPAILDSSEFARSNYAMNFGSAFVVRAERSSSTSSSGSSNSPDPQGAYAVPELVPDMNSAARWDTDGPFRADGQRRITELEDGTSKTVLVSEVLASENDREPPGARGLWSICLAGSSIYTHQYPPNEKEFGDSIWTGLGFECVSEAQGGMPCFDTPASTIGEQYASARSSHVGSGVNVVYADEHTGFVTDQVEPAIWRAIATTSRGENVEAPD